MVQYTCPNFLLHVLSKKDTIKGLACKESCKKLNFNAFSKFGRSFQSSDREKCLTKQVEKLMPLYSWKSIKAQPNFLKTYEKTTAGCKSICPFCQFWFEFLSPHLLRSNGMASFAYESLCILHPLSFK